MIPLTIKKEESLKKGKKPSKSEVESIGKYTQHVAYSFSLSESKLKRGTNTNTKS